MGEWWVVLQRGAYCYFHTWGMSARQGKAYTPVPWSPSSLDPLDQVTTGAWAQTRIREWPVDSRNTISVVSEE